MTAIQNTPAPVPVLGIDPGSRWTAGVVRYGDRAVIGWTLGPVNPAGELEPGAMDDVNDWTAYTRYITRVLDAAYRSVRGMRERYGSCPVAVRRCIVPGARVIGSGPFRDWVIPQRITGSLLAAFPDAVLTEPPDRPTALRSYPAELIGTRPGGWGPGEARRGDRSHERVAYDVAGVLAADRLGGSR